MRKPVLPYIHPTPSKNRIFKGGGGAVYTVYLVVK